MGPRTAVVDSPRCGWAPSLPYVDGADVGAVAPAVGGASADLLGPEEARPGSAAAGSGDRGDDNLAAVPSGDFGVNVVRSFWVKDSE